MSARRDEEFTQYASAHLAGFRRLAYLLCQDWHRADDLVQAAITRLYVQWGRASAVDHTDAYARTILVREFLREQRSGWARRVSLEATMPDCPGFAPDSDIALDVRTALAALPPRQRATLVLRFYCDLSVEQAAELLGCSAGTVKSQTAKGIAAMRARLGPSLWPGYRDPAASLEVIDHGETAVRSLLAVAARDDDAPPCGVSVPLARRRGRRRLRLLRVYLPGAAPMAAGVAVALVISLPAALSGTSSQTGARPGRPAAMAPTPAPSRFNPLVPYAAFGWLPTGFSTAAAAGAGDESTPTRLTLQAFAPVSDGRMAQVTVAAAGACRIGPTPAAMKSTTIGAPARTLSCTDQSPFEASRFAELVSAAPDVNGDPAYWTPQGALEWQYAAGAWAEVMPMVNPQVCVHCAPNNLAGWRNVPATADRVRAGLTSSARAASPQSAASKALLAKIAADMRYGATQPLVFGFQLAGLPAGWQVAADYSFTPQAGLLTATGISAGPAVDPTALGVSVGPAVSPTSEYACMVIAGQTSDVTVAGAPALVRNLDEPDKQFQTLCANDIDGASVYVAMDLNSPGSNAPLPGTDMFGSVLAVFGSVHLLGPDPAAWTTNPLR